MDGAQFQARQRTYPRAPSRSSTHTNTSRMTPISANSSTSQIATSPQPSQSHPSHRYHHSQCGTGSPQLMSRATPPLSRQESIESTRQPAVSSFLQEKLQRERRAESEKLNQSQTSLPRSNPDMAASVDLGRAPNSPFKIISEGNRPQSSTGFDQGKKKGLGVKEMEKVISTLHKQNFDLKLELYHRRERQTNLEERLDALENDKQRMEAMNDKLLIELEKRDKAVEEAVAMIVTLEAKVDHLFCERTMVRHVENDGFFCPRDYDMSYRTPVPQGVGPDIARMEDDVKVVNRMPSFLSDYSETTQNLRNVYLGSKASMLSLTRVAEGSPEADNMRVLGSPTLSVLSESSFASIYGRKEKGLSADQTPAEANENLDLDGADSGFVKVVNGEQPPRNHTRSVSSGKRAGSHTSSMSQFQSITDVINGSPLQRLERLDMSYGGRKEPGRPQSQGKDSPKVQFMPDAKSSGPRNQKQDKRDALRRVITDGQGGVRLHEQVLPPTPDTVSSSVLRRFKGSNDTLSQPDLNEDNSDGVVLNPVGGQKGSQRDDRLVALPNGASDEADSWASPSQQTLDSLFQHRGPLIPRPRSADESTASHRRGKGWDSDDDDDSDVNSLQSSLDIWMRESGQPSRNKGRASPDLFSFPTGPSKGSWAAPAPPGPNGTSAEHAQMPPGFDYMRDLFSLRQGLFTGSAPPPPNRRSSLHARTGSKSDAASQAASSQAEDSVPPSTARRRSHHSRQGSVDFAGRDDMRTPVQRDQFAPPAQPSSDQKPKHYPPISGHQQGARAGLNRLFRRSTSGAPPTPTSENAPSAETAPSEPFIRSSSSMGVPSWANRSSAVEEDRSGATPPPIMFNPRQGRRNTMGAEGESEKPTMQDLGRSKTPGPAMALAAAAAVATNASFADVEQSPGAGGVAGPGARRRWFSRTSNSKNKLG